MLKAKTASPLDPVEPSTTFIEAHATWLATIVELEADTAAFTRANQQIQAVKDANAAADKTSAEAALAKLRAVKKRHTEPVLGLTNNYAAPLDENKSLVEAKAAKKDALNTHHNPDHGA